MQYQALAPTDNTQNNTGAPTLAKPFEPVKYPTEDLRIKQPKTSVTRPPLKFWSDDVPEGVEAPEKETGVLMKSMGPLLCSWETLNVHDTIYSLDSFTFDDFVDAMRYSHETPECELLTEVHCAVLKQIITDSGKIQAPLPKVDESDESDEESSTKSTSPEPEPEPPVRTTRSSLRKSEASIIVKQRTPTPEPPKQIHKAAEFLEDFDWIEQCKIRDFRDGGWQAIFVGLLYRLSSNPTQKQAVDEILAELVPQDEEEPSRETIKDRYTHLDVNLRIVALEMVLQLTVATETFRDQLTAASLEMTRLRKEKIEFQKKRKEL
jgi:alpha-1,3-glucosyltransferase